MRWIPALLVLTTAVQDAPRHATPELDASTFRDVARFIRPTAAECRWEAIPWRTSLSDAAREAARLDRPLLLWTMNGHPCGTT